MIRSYKNYFFYIFLTDYIKKRRRGDKCVEIKWIVSREDGGRGIYNRVFILFWWFLRER